MGHINVSSHMSHLFPHSPYEDSGHVLVAQTLQILQVIRPQPLSLNYPSAAQLLSTTLSVSRIFHCSAFLFPYGTQKQFLCI